MSLLKNVLGLALVAGLTACGGGGGSAGSSTGVTPGVVVSADPILSGLLQDAAGLTTSSISASGYTVMKVTLTDPSGKGIPDQVVTATGDPTKVVFPEGTGGLTNAAGVATIKVGRASLFATGADNLTVTYSYKAGSFTKYPDGSIPPSADKMLTRSVGYQFSASNISLTNLDIGAPTLAAYGTRQVSVQANINGVATSSTPVQVSFSANCGVVTPATASTNSQGIVQVIYSAINLDAPNDQGCSGSTVSIVASTTGAAPVSGNLSIDLAPATNLLFVDAKPTTIFLAGSGGATQSVVKFRLVNASNSALQGQNVLLELKDLSGGIPKTTFGTIGNVSAITQPTNTSGEVSIPVFSGTIPTNVMVKASLVSNPKVSTTSAVLAIASGRAVQSRVSLSVKDFAIEGGNIDGVTTQVTMSLADRQGNPVPDGTAINFVTEGGVMIPPVCTTVKSTCSVELRSQNPRPADGRVSILAYAAGEEDFTDLNFDNVYTPATSDSPEEPFTDLGNAFRQDAALVGGVAGSYVDGYFSVPRAGSATCTKVIAGQSNFLGRPNSCDGAWGAADVRQQLVIAFSTSQASIINPVWTQAVNESYKGAPNLNNVANTLAVTIQDLNGNSMPGGSTIAAKAVDKTPSDPKLTAADSDAGGLACTVDGSSISVIPNTLVPVGLQINLKDCVRGDQIQVTVTSPSGLATPEFFTVP